MKIDFLKKTNLVNLVNNNTFKKIFINSGWLFFDQLVRLGFGFFTLMYIARSFGPDNFGIYNFAFAFFGIFASLATLGLERIILRDFVAEPNKKSEIIFTSFFLRLVGALIATLISSISLLFLKNNQQITFILLSFLNFALIFQSFEVIDYWYQSKIQSKYIIMIKTPLFIIFSFVKIIYLLNYNSLTHFVFIMMIETIVASLSMIILYLFHKNSISLTVNKNRALNMFRQGMPLIFSSFFVTIYVKIDQIILNSLAGNLETGIYSAAVRISEIPFFLGVIISNSFFPIIIKKKKENIIEYYKYLQYLFDIVVILGISISIFISIFSKLIISVVYGEAFINSSFILSIHIWSIIFVFLGVAQGVWMIAEGYTNLSFIFTLVGAIINIILNFLLIPKFGAIGATIATLISYFITGMLMNIIFNKSRNIFFMQLKSFVLFRYINYLKNL